MKPRMLWATVSADRLWHLTRDFVDCTFAFDGVKCNMGYDKAKTLFVIVWHDTLSLEEALDRAQRSVTRGRIESMFAQSIEGPMAAKDDDDLVAEMVNQAWLEWNEALN